MWCVLKFKVFCEDERELNKYIWMKFFRFFLKSHCQRMKTKLHFLFCSFFLTYNQKLCEVLSDHGWTYNNNYGNRIILCIYIRPHSYTFSFVLQGKSCVPQSSLKENIFEEIWFSRCETSLNTQGLWQPDLPVTGQRQELTLKFLQ